MLSPAQIERYSRQILLREVGAKGQRRLLEATVEIPQLDAEGRSTAMWLARAGVGRLLLPDDRSPAPEMDSSGLLFAADAGRPLIDAVRERLKFHAPDLVCEIGEVSGAARKSAIAIARELLSEPPK